MRTRGFTLIELLVVITIILILISLLCPALSAAYEMAMELQCINNVRIFCMATINYASEHDGRMPFPNWPYRGGSSHNPFPGGGFLFAFADANTGFASSASASPAWPNFNASEYGENPNRPEKVDTGQLWQYLGSLEAYRCPLDQVDELDPTLMVNLSTYGAWGGRKSVPEPQSVRVLS
ncbi:MAG: prepilin-type N-terminal cleavage/methylation domain-containing protein, partial [Planctomycetia bacterium]|nr:prepilin-type N-terminal cleavage/methylation domain-containing protein [Planctomycetia bacterium]